MSYEREVLRGNSVRGIWALEKVKAFQQVANQHSVTVEVTAVAGEAYETKRGIGLTVPEGKAHVMIHNNGRDLGAFYADADIELNLQDKSPISRFYARHIKPKINP
ncbi:hypothetical protein IID21_03085 [Patescibacteria group bacterium]|nr:hypothetical protein [Patescibacteria group bacterium]